MNESPAALSDEALSRLLFDSHVTTRCAAGATDAVLGRLRRFSQFYGSLGNKPDGAALLCQEPGTGAVQCHPLGPNLVVGRSGKGERNPAGCDLAFADDQMSRRHFEIQLADGFYILRDLESRNGTYVNDDPRRIREHVLKAGDIILAGGVIFVFSGG